MTAYTSIRLPKELAERLAGLKLRYQVEHNIPQLAMHEFLQAIVSELEAR